ncbi:MAG: PEP-CTERM sorting domain-containing protein [Burkholderiales bacterium]|nr:PEP-CTERM sorting domain-containing protein [Opitutaceae bacterium]
MTNTSTIPAASFRERIAARQAQFTAPAVAAAALALGTLTPATAEAAIYVIASPSPNSVNFDPLDGSTAPGSFSPSTENPIYLDACGGGRFSLLPALANSNNFSYFGADPAGFFHITPITAGVTIDGSGIFHEAASSEITTPPSFYDDTTLHYVGFRYTNQGAGSNETYYGWAEFTLPSNGTATLLRFALGGNGEAIVTGQDVSAIPEPSAAAALLGTLALGATFSLRRRRR